MTWTSNVAGLLGTGNPLTYNTGPMAYGAHTITARATDLQGNSATDTVTLTIVNDPPTVDLYTPLRVPSAPARRSPSVRRSSTSTRSAPPCPTRGSVGASPVASTFATGKTVVNSFGTVGNVQVIVLAIDDQGATDEDWVNLGIVGCTDAPPTVAITSPASDIELVYDGYDDGRGQWYADVTLVGNASDPEDGALTGGDLVWTTSYAGQAPLLGTGASLTTRLYSSTCTGVTHTVTLTATDSGGNVRTAVVRIRIWTLC